MKLRGYKSNQTNMWSLQFFSEKDETWETIPTRIPFSSKESIIEWLDNAIKNGDQYGPEDTTAEYDISGIHLS